MAVVQLPSLLNAPLYNEGAFLLLQSGKLIMKKLNISLEVEMMVMQMLLGFAIKVLILPVDFFPVTAFSGTF